MSIKVYGQTEKELLTYLSSVIVWHHWSAEAPVVPLPRKPPEPFRHLLLIPTAYRVSTIHKSSLCVYKCSLLIDYLLSCICCSHSAIISKSLCLLTELDTKLPPNTSCQHFASELNLLCWTAVAHPIRHCASWSASIYIQATANLPWIEEMSKF